ncbi:hypothetical protein B0H14DRAFT_2606145 [Mycena olivaceomarginata]|nr:hypothetical protein B0H14DRAFT_2606145 [Mycena olivaceomarginata]
MSCPRLWRGLRGNIRQHRELLNPLRRYAQSSGTLGGDCIRSEILSRSVCLWRPLPVPRTDLRPHRAAIGTIPLAVSHQVLARDPSLVLPLTIRGRIVQMRDGPLWQRGDRASPSIPPQSKLPNRFHFASRGASIFILFWGLGKVVNTERRTLILYHHHDSVKLSHCALPQYSKFSQEMASRFARGAAAQKMCRLCPIQRAPCQGTPPEGARTLKEGDDELERARAQARANSARYRAQNRERLAARARNDRKTAFVAKYSFRAYLERHLDNL